MDTLTRGIMVENLKYLNTSTSMIQKVVSTVNPDCDGCMDTCNTG